MRLSSRARLRQLRHLEIYSFKLIGIQRMRIEQLVKEQTAVTPDTALRLSNALETPAEFWINMQANFDMASARKACRYARH